MCVYHKIVLFFFHFRNMVDEICVKIDIRGKYWIKNSLEIIRV
jgi:hypothetical protein